MIKTLNNLQKAINGAWFNLYQRSRASLPFLSLFDQSIKSLDRSITGSAYGAINSLSLMRYCPVTMALQVISQLSFAALQGESRSRITGRIGKVKYDKS